MPMPESPDRFVRTVQASKLKGLDRWELVEKHPLFDTYRVKAPNAGYCEKCKAKGRSRAKRGEMIEIVHPVLRTPYVKLNIPKGAHGSSEFRRVPRKAVKVLGTKRVCLGCGGFVREAKDLPKEATNPHKTNKVEAIPTRKPSKKDVQAQKEPTLFADTL